MKKLSLLFVLLPLFSCIKEAPKEDTRHFNSENEWIVNVMKNYYLYRDDIPTKLDSEKESPDFFYSLLSPKDGKNSQPFSRIEQRQNTTRSIHSESTYGFDFVVYNVSKGYYAARILYVLKNSPADKAALKRGDYIFMMNNKYLSGTNINELCSGGSKELNIVENSTVSPYSEWKFVKRKIGASVPIENSPIYKHKVITQGTKKIGYLVYNRFSSGKNEDSNENKRYNDQLCTISNEFAAGQISEFILDLRYNGGGMIEAAQVLATLIVKKNALDQVFCKLQDVKGKIVEYHFRNSIIKNGTNLNLNRLIVLTSQYTASASELIINSLRPYMDIIIMGDVTVGKNVASVSYKHKDYNSILKPITHYVYNRDNKADYEDGFTPDYLLDDFQNKNAMLYDLGDRNEFLLKKALKFIDNQSIAATTKAIKNNYKIIYKPKSTDIIISE